MRAEEYVTKDEFNKFLEEYRKNVEENKKLREQNTDLKQEVETLKTVSSEVKIDEQVDKLVGESVRKLREDIPASGTTKFLLSGWADAGYEHRPNANPTFTASFHPVFLWKIDERTSLESDLTYSVISYHFDDLATLGAGKFLTPFGAFIRRQHETWANKLPDDPLALDINNGLVPSYSVGAQITGGFAICDTHFNYATYVANGPKLNISDPAHYGALDFNNDPDTNRGKAVGGRFAVLPTQDLEIGISGQSGRVGQHNTVFSDVDSLLYGADISYVNDFDCLRGQIDLKAEWVASRVDKAVYTFGATKYPFLDDNRNGGYVQAAYRPMKLKQRYVRNLEIALRYDRLENPDSGPHIPGFSAAQFQDHDRFTIGLDYWLGPRSVVKFAFEKDHGHDRSFLLQYALGF